MVISEQILSLRELLKGNGEKLFQLKLSGADRTCEPNNCRGLDIQLETIRHAELLGQVSRGIAVGGDHTADPQ